MKAWQSSYLAGANASYLEALYEDFLADPNTVPLEWQTVFKNLTNTSSLPQDIPHSEVRKYFSHLARVPRKSLLPEQKPSHDIEYEKKQIRVLQLIDAYRTNGHRKADCDPLKLQTKAEFPELALAFHRLLESDLDITFSAGSLRDILQTLEDTYCQTIGFEITHILDTQEKQWVQNRVESWRFRPSLSDDIKKHILQKLVAAEGLETYLHRRYVGQKRFSLEGGDSIIAALSNMMNHAAGSGVKEVVIGMAHRGRLNVLVNILGRSPASIFQEFEGKYANNNGAGSGDVKYHLGFSSDIQTEKGPLHIALAFNPSHLEIVSPVVMGSVRARQERYRELGKTTILPIILHGDASFAGQGIVMETFNMSQTNGFSVGGTLHILINNQIGFTTSNPQDARSTLYCSDVAKMVQAPIFHVNGDDPEAVLWVIEAALDYRMTFKKDVVVDLVCYRRHGHNEADEPSATQPVMYQHIKKHPTVLTLYSQKLVQEGLVTEADVTHLSKNYRAALEAGNPVIDNLIPQTTRPFLKDWQPFVEERLASPWGEVNTKVPLGTLQTLAHTLEKIPHGFTLHPRVKKIIEDRQKITQGTLPVDWGYAETLAYASLLNEGAAIRLTGQDVRRGTFFHRHATLHDVENGNTVTPLEHIKENQPTFSVIDSPLSEAGVLAFEYGYSTTDPKTLVIWEAQYGDFANGAQVVIDQFISSGEQKWGRVSGLVMLLPHGYEGQGPEHSSARLERYLQLCAEHNMQVCVPSTPAQVFHMLRRQMKNRVKKPLICMTPKSGLRHKLATSTLKELSEGTFHPVIGETEPHDPQKIKRIILCCGKTYYDLATKRAEAQKNDCVIIRIEQLYPFPESILRTTLEQYPNAHDVIWCQEEPKNQGVWYSSQHHFRHCLQKHQTLQYGGRPDSASPAVGASTVHSQQEQALLKEALQL